MSRAVHILVTIAVLLVGGTLAAAESSSAEAIEILRGIETTRTSAKPFRMKGSMGHLLPKFVWSVDFVVESEAEKYRVSVENPQGTVAISDGTQLFQYDGRASAIVTTLEDGGSARLAFDPRSLGLSNGMHSYLTFEENIAYHSGTDVTMARREGSELVTIELTDRFSQRIRFDVEPQSPFRMHYYSKTVPDPRGGILATYVTETTYWPDEPDTWIPRKLVMYTISGDEPDRKKGKTLVEFAKPEFVDGFDPDIWTAKGLSLPVGQPLADLRTKMRIGYWDGNKLVESLPAR